YIREHYEVDMYREGIRKLLHRMRLSWTRPTYTLAKGDAEQQQAFEKQMDLIKKN
ncbi:winged helix-turn-helix domain-containing protein, partial [Anoxybacillus geothermalis]|nr:winged helix-turn-helix domain-containing protein [Anoxybacillus geothermalis]